MTMRDLVRGALVDAIAWRTTTLERRAETPSCVAALEIAGLSARTGTRG